MKKYTLEFPCLHGSSDGAAINNLSLTLYLRNTWFYLNVIGI